MRTKRCRRDCPHRHPACQDHCEILKRQNEERKEKEKWLKEQVKMSELDIYHLKNPSYVMMGRKRKAPREAATSQRRTGKTFNIIVTEREEKVNGK